VIEFGGRLAATTAKGINIIIKGINWENVG